MAEDRPGFADKRGDIRRQVDDRRKEERVNLDDDVEDHERRVGEERRTWPFGLIYNTPHTAVTLEDWLEENCQGDWNITIDGIDTERKLKSFKVMFDEEKDKKAFVANFAR